MCPTERTSRWLRNSSEYVGATLRTGELLAQIGKHVFPCRNVVGALVVLQSPLFFGPVQLAQVIHASVHCRSGPSTDKRR